MNIALTQRAAAAAVLLAVVLLTQQALSRQGQQRWALRLRLLLA
jgi:negative regulator of sigma E activity